MQTSAIVLLLESCFPIVTIFATRYHVVYVTYLVWKTLDWQDVVNNVSFFDHTTCFAVLAHMIVTIKHYFTIRLPLFTVIELILFSLSCITIA